MSAMAGDGVPTREEVDEFVTRAMASQDEEIDSRWEQGNDALEQLLDRPCDDALR